MTKNKNVLKALVLAGAIVNIGLFAFTTQKVSAFSGGTGTSGDPWQITTPSELADLNSYLGSSHTDKYFELANNIDLNVSPYNSGSGWTPIGSNSGSSFRGNFNGNGYTISNLFIDRSLDNYQGLFGYVYANGVVENFVLSDVDVTGGGTGVAGAVGQNYYGTVRKVGVEGGTISGLMRLGGVIGNSDNGTNSEIYSTGVTITQRAASNECCVGGVVGSNERSSTLTNAYSTNNIVHTSGGQGSFGGAVGNTYNSGAMSNIYSTGAISTLSSFPSNVGGLIGNNYVSATDSYWDTESSGLLTSGSGTGKTTSEMKTQGTYAGWDFTNTWAINPSVNDGYPYLQWQNFTSPPSVQTDAVSSLDTTSVTLNGEVTSSGSASLTRRGFVYGASSQSDPGNVAPESSGYGTVLDDDVVEVGTFSEVLSSLNPNGTFYYRAFATNSEGTTYGDEVSFTTLQNPAVTSPTANSSINQLDLDFRLYSGMVNDSLQLNLTGDQNYSFTLSNFTAGVDHSITIDLTDIANSSYVSSSSGLTGDGIEDGTYSFTLRYQDIGSGTILSTAVSNVFVDTTAPAVQSLSPANGSSSASLDTDLIITFDEAVGAETGNITIYKASDDSEVEVIDVAGGPISGNGSNTITVNPVNDLVYGTEYYIQVASTALRDLRGNDYTGISDTTTWSFTTMENPDPDADGISSAIENAAPNSGDANNDGTPDNQQTNVASWVNQLNNKNVTVAVNEDCSLTQARSQEESSYSVQDSAFDYPAGLVNFTANCGTNGYTATVQLFFFDSSSDVNVVRKYNPNTNAYFTLTGEYGATTEYVTIGEQVASKVSYQVTDGGDLDIDGLANGIIIDPAGLAQTTVSSPNTGLPQILNMLIVNG